MRGHFAIQILPAALLLAACTSTGAGDASESYVATEDGQLLYYTKVGEGAETLVVPGAAWVSRDMQQLARGRTVIFYDPRGRGRSKVGYGYSLQQDLDDLETIRAWFGLERFSLLGMGYHGALASFYAARHPGRVERLVVVSPPPIRKFPYWDIYQQVFEDRSKRENYGKLNEMRVNRVDQTDPELYAWTFRNAIFAAWVKDESSLKRMQSSPFVEPNLSPERVITQYFDLLRKFGEWDWRAEVARVSCPTLVIYGTADPMPTESSVEWVANIPGARAHVVEGSGRFPWVERSSEFFSAVETFLRR